MVHWCCVKKKRPSSSSCAAPFLGGRQRLHPPSAAFAWASHQYHTRLFLPEAPQLPAAVASSWTRSIKAPLLTTLESCQLTLPRPVTKSQSFFCGSTDKQQEDLFYRLGLSQKKRKEDKFCKARKSETSGSAELVNGSTGRELPDDVNCFELNSLGRSVDLFIVSKCVMNRAGVLQLWSVSAIIREDGRKQKAP